MMHKMEKGDKYNTMWDHYEKGNEAPARGDTWNLFGRVVMYLFFQLLLLQGCGSPHVAEFTHNSQPVTAESESNSLDSIIGPYREGLIAQMNEVIGTSDSSLAKFTPESPLGNFAADVVFKAGMDYSDKHGDVGCDLTNTMSLLNFGGLRAPLNQGNITVGNIFELMPFDNTMVICKLKSDAVSEMFMYWRKKGGQPIGNAKADLTGEQQKLTLAGRTYGFGEDIYIITSDYLAGGGDDMAFLVNRIGFWDTGILIRDVFLDFVRANKKIGYYSVEGRMILPN